MTGRVGPYSHIYAHEQLDVEVGRHFAPVDCTVQDVEDNGAARPQDLIPDLLSQIRVVHQVGGVVLGLVGLALLIAGVRMGPYGLPPALVGRPAAPRDVATRGHAIQL